MTTEKSHRFQQPWRAFWKVNSFCTSYPSGGFRVLMLEPCSQKPLLLWEVNSDPSSYACIFPHRLSSCFSSTFCLFPLSVFYIHPMRCLILMENLECRNNILTWRWRNWGPESQRHTHIVTCFIHLSSLSLFIKVESLNTCESLTPAGSLSIFLTLWGS